MKAAHFVGLKQLEIVDLPTPRIDRPDAVLLRIDRVGVCGSDVHYYLDGRIGDQVLAFPATVGHECAGTVVEIGTNVASLQPGDRVAVDPAMACGTCDQCQAGRPNTCRNLLFMGCPGGAPGAIAEFRVVPAENCFPIPDAMSLDTAALVEPLAVGMHAVRLAIRQIVADRLGATGSMCVIGSASVPLALPVLTPHLKARVSWFPPATPHAQRPWHTTSEPRILVIGAGPIGLSVLLCVKAAGPCVVYATDLLAERLAVARRCGADWTGNAGHGEANAAIAKSEPLGVDVVFECAGDPLCVDEAQTLLRPGGTLMLVGSPPTDRVIFDIHRMRRKELTFQSVRRQRDCTAASINAIADGQIDPSPLLTHRFPLEKIAEAFALVAGYRDGVVKALIDVSGIP
jgi:L-iditol 2-dehydrogenase